MFAKDTFGRGVLSRISKAHLKLYNKNPLKKMGKRYEQAPHQGMYADISPKNPYEMMLYIIYYKEIADKNNSIPWHTF